jgi:uncharacterized SAM-binding protein YcdF (DUF218 family)
LKELAIALLVPPLSLLPLGLAGVALSGRWRRAGRALAAFAVCGLFALSLPAVGGSLLMSLEHGLPLAVPANQPPAAIVILGGEVIRGRMPALGIGPLTLQRVRAGAALHRRVGLPVLVTGGALGEGEEPIARLMARVLVDEFDTPVRWIEPEAGDTWENAQNSAAILKADGIRSIYLVTHAWHMRRALLAFSHFGITVTAAPTQLDRAATGDWFDFVPHVGGWAMSYYAMHEWIGCAYYALRG